MTEYEQCLIQEILLEVENYSIDCVHRKRIERIIEILLRPTEINPESSNGKQY
jgi:hypothetical protein